MLDYRKFDLFLSTGGEDSDEPREPYIFVGHDWFENFEMTGKDIYPEKTLRELVADLMDLCSTPDGSYYDLRVANAIRAAIEAGIRDGIGNAKPGIYRETDSGGQWEDA